MENLLSSLITFLSGGILWEGFKFFYPDLRRKIDQKKEAKKQFYSNLNPILKSSDELYGKLYSLSKEDFATFINTNHSNSDDPEHNRKYIYYLFAQFWAQLEFIRLQSQYISLTSINEGKELLRFIETFESKTFRILDRSIQRIIGESLILNSNKDFRIMSLYEFVNTLDKEDQELKKWIKLLNDKMRQVDETEVRQMFLVYGIIVAALIDHFDPKHKIVRNTTIYLNKLNTTSIKRMRSKLFSNYLWFVKNSEKYLGRPPDLHA